MKPNSPPLAGPGIHLNKRYTPKVVLQPWARKAILKGIDQMINVIRPTLGPLPRSVLIESEGLRGDSPEILYDGATILRRLMEIPNRTENVGAMIARHLLWRQHEAVGDGTVTAGVIFQAIFHEAYRYIEAGYDNSQIRDEIKECLPLILAEIQKGTRSIEGKESIQQYAFSLIHDRNLANTLSEVIDMIGPDGYVFIETNYQTGNRCEYVEGSYWENGWCSSGFAGQTGLREVRIKDPSILISDFLINTPDEIYPFLESVHQAGIRSIMLIVSKMEEAAIRFLLANKANGIVDSVAVFAPKVGFERRQMLEDIAIMTGGQVISQDEGSLLENVSVDRLGKARRAWATADHFGFIGGYGNPIQLRERFSEVRQKIKGATRNEDEEFQRQRLAHLTGSLARVWIGAHTETELETKKAEVKRSVKALRLALEEGVVPGGGCILLKIKEFLPNTMGGRIMSRAIEEPLRVIAWNCGYEPNTVANHVASTNPDMGFNALNGQYVNMWADNIYDSSAVLQSAIEKAVSGAVMAMSTDVIVHRKKPERAINP